MVQMIRMVVIENWTRTRTFRSDEPLGLQICEIVLCVDGVAEFTG